MFTWQWGKVFAQGPGDTAGFIRIHFNTRETLLTSNACARITLQTLTKQHMSHKAMLVNPQNNTLRDNICRSYICVVILVLEKVSVFLKKNLLICFSVLDRLQLRDLGGNVGGLGRDTRERHANKDALIFFLLSFLLCCVFYFLPVCHCRLKLNL